MAREAIVRRTRPSPMPRANLSLRPASRGILAAVMVGVGALHFVMSDPFVRIVPAWLPAPLVLVWVSGFFEILGGVGLLVRRARRAASYGLVALYLAVFPANVNMAVNDLTFDGTHHLPPALLWLRLPLQVVLIAWALWVGRDDPRRAEAG
jgi:uncharacterized membrane protein